MPPKGIHKDQKGYMKGRNIGENIKLLYDVLLQAETKNIPGLLLMVGFEKAFDSLIKLWAFLKT